MIRPATMDDLTPLTEMMQEFYAESGYLLDQKKAKAAFCRLPRDHSLGAIWIAFEKAQPAGYGVTTLRFSMEYGGLDAFIDDFFVRSDYRRRGLGGALLNAFFSEVAQRDVRVVHVEADREGVAARALYGAFGFCDSGQQLLTLSLPEVGSSLASPGKRRL